MLLDQQLQQLFYDLIHHEVAVINLGRGEIFVRIFDDASKMSFSTPVYSGDQYIPLNVRHCVAKNGTLKNYSASTYLKLDEKNFKVQLNSLNTTENLNHHNFKKLIHEFHQLAEKWRDILDKHDRDDLVHVPVQ